jgi:hypothetical protein
MTSAESIGRAAVNVGKGFAVFLAMLDPLALAVVPSIRTHAHPATL